MLYTPFFKSLFRMRTFKSATASCSNWSSFLYLEPSLYLLVELTLDQHGFELGIHLYMDFFPINTTVHNLQLVESSDLELGIWRANCKVRHHKPPSCSMVNYWITPLPHRMSPSLSPTGHPHFCSAVPLYNVPQFHFNFLSHSIYHSLKYSWPLNNMGLNCTGPLICKFFQQ